MGEITRRGYAPNDIKEFDEAALERLKNAGEDLFYLLNRNYKIKGASTFIGNHYMLSERQRLAIVRSVAPREDIEVRKCKRAELEHISCINIDGFNTIITLEVALSGSLLVEGMDGAIRDLAGLRGTYRIIDKTKLAVKYMLETLDEAGIQKACIWLDAPVSNSGRLKKLILEIGEAYQVATEVEVINAVDTVLSDLEGVITSDAIILNTCKSWVNLNQEIINKYITDAWCVRCWR